MISQVTTSGATWNELPYKFEAGTPNIAGVIGMGAAITYLQGLDLEKALVFENSLANKVRKKLLQNPNVTLYTKDDKDRVATVTFYHKTVHPHDLAAVFDSLGVCIRGGHHCAQPLMDYLGVEATSRASFYLYNTEEDANKFLEPNWLKELSKSTT